MSCNTLCPCISSVWEQYQISSKLLRAGAPVLNKHITTLVNNTIKTSVFPTRLKEAQVVPLHKKKK